MKAKFKVKDEFRLRKDETFTRSFPLGGYNTEGSVRDIDKANERAGSVATVYEIHDQSSLNCSSHWSGFEGGGDAARPLCECGALAARSAIWR
jgi:hypothetical protein